jgi:translation initiation factor IF-1
MVKNFGGNKAKGFARKNMAKKDNVLRVVEQEGEVYAQVTKIFGGTMCQVTTIEGKTMNCHIRGKFCGRGKRDNLIEINKWVMVGLREWENQEAKGKTPNCDLLEVYSDSDKIRLKNNVTNVNWSKFVSNDSKNLGNDNIEDDEFEGFTFADQATIEYQELIQSQLAASKAGVVSSITTNDGEIIDVDDI